MNNIYHRYLNLPFEITKPPICNIPLKELKHQDIPYHVDENMSNFLQKLNLRVANTEVFFTPGGGKLPIHIDDWKMDNHVKINISYGPPEGTTRWWKSLKFNNEKEYKDGGYDISSHYNIHYENFTDRHHRSIWLKEEDCELIYEASTNKPSLVNVGTFHSSYNPTNIGRWTLCFVIGTQDDYLYWDDAVKVFQDYIE